MVNCTVRPVSTKHYSLEQRRIYYRFMQGDGWLIPWEPQSWLLNALVKSLKSERWEMDMVSCCRLLGVRSLVLQVRSWSGSDDLVNLYQMNVILCLGKKGKVPSQSFHPSRSQSWLRGGRSQLASPSGPDSHILSSQLSSLREPYTQSNWPSVSSGHPKGETSSHRL